MNISLITLSLVLTLFISGCSQDEQKKTAQEKEQKEVMSQNNLTCQFQDGTPKKIKCKLDVDVKKFDRKVTFFWDSPNSEKDNRTVIRTIKANHKFVFDYRYIKGRPEGVWKVKTTIEGSRKNKARFLLKDGKVTQVYIQGEGVRLALQKVDYIAVEGLNLRSQPVVVDNTIVDVIEDGWVSVTIKQKYQGSKNNWLEIETNDGRSGWIVADYVKQLDLTKSDKYVLARYKYELEKSNANEIIRLNNMYVFYKKYVKSDEIKSKMDKLYNDHISKTNIIAIVMDKGNNETEVLIPVAIESNGVVSPNVDMSTLPHRWYWNGTEKTIKLSKKALTTKEYLDFASDQISVWPNVKAIASNTRVTSHSVDVVTNKDFTEEFNSYILKSLLPDDTNIEEIEVNDISVININDKNMKLFYVNGIKTSFDGEMTSVSAYILQKSLKAFDKNNALVILFRENIDMKPISVITIRRNAYLLRENTNASKHSIILEKISLKGLHGLVELEAPIVETEEEQY